jgi:hypothetical protein
MILTAASTNGRGRIERTAAEQATINVKCLLRPIFNVEPALGLLWFSKQLAQVDGCITRDAHQRAHVVFKNLQILFHRIRQGGAGQRRVFVLSTLLIVLLDALSQVLFIEK